MTIQGNQESNIVSLSVNGIRYEGWLSVSIDHGIDQLAGAYSLDITDKWSGQTSGWAIQAGDSCVVKIGQDTVITGYVDVVDSILDKQSHSISVTGRDKTGDLVDCAVATKEYSGQNFEFIATDVCKPFGIYVDTQLQSTENGYSGKIEKKQATTGGSKIPRQSTETGDTCHEFLKKIAGIQAVLLISDRNGGLLITRSGLAGRATDSLIEGENIKSIQFTHDFTNLFSNISIKGQAHRAKTTHGQTLDAKEATLAKGDVTRAQSSGSVGRYRPLVIEADQQADAARCQRVAEWEASTREAKSRAVNVTVQGWRQSDGLLWRINTTTIVQSQSMRLNEEMLISNLTFGLDLSGGSITTLTLYPKEAFDLLPEMPKNDEPKKSERGKGKKEKKGKATKGGYYDFTKDDGSLIGGGRVAKGKQEDNEDD